MGLPDDVILDLDVALASVSENGASYEITFGQPRGYSVIGSVERRHNRMFSFKIHF